MASGGAPGPDEARRAVELFQQGLDVQVVAVAQELTRRYPEHGLGWMLLGASLKRQQKFAEAVHPQQRAVDLLPGRPELHSNLGSTQYRLGLFDQAEASYRRALAIQPTHADALFNLGRLQTRQERFAESAATFGRLVQANPRDGEAHAERGIALAGLEQWIEAEQLYRRALELGHRDGIVLDHLARSLLEQGRPQEALDAMREAVAAEPGSPSLLRNFLFTRNHVPGPEAPGLPDEARQLDRAITAAAGDARPAWSCEVQPQVLRVGFVSGDLRRHPVASFLVGFIGKTSQHALALYAYDTSTREDEVTARLKADFTGWRSIAGLPAAEAAALIAADGIHVLVDLAGHTADNRLDVFALSPAPVQLTWYGIPATTGMTSIDAMLTAPGASVPQDQAWFSERLQPLPESWFCYAPLEPAPDVAPLPALANGHVTFGSFNSLSKINDAVIRTWSRVLHAVPHSRLVLRNWQFTHDAMRQLLLRRFAGQGIAAGRLQLESPIVSLSEHLGRYGRIDIGLDPYPYVGGTTTTEALFMGVPVLTLRGMGRMLRIGESLLHLAGLPEWIAQDEDGYVAKAARFAADLPALADTRAGLRPRLQATSLLDGTRFARQFSETLWGLWRETGASRAASRSAR